MFNRPINDFETLMTILSATPPLWIPEDDLLLKNAVEAGASLEALAKGAVQFSRKFSVQELQERWHSLLYDPDISAEASARMFELELSASSITPKLSSSGSSSRNMEVPSKRKFESIRSLYHAMRKKTCSQPSNLHGLNVLGSSVANACLGYGSGFQERLQPHNDSAIGDVIHNQFGLKDIGVDILCDPTQDPTLERSARIEFSRTVSSLSDKEMIMHGTFEHTNEHGDSTHVLEKSLVQFGNGSGIEIIGPSGPMPDGMGYSSPQPGLPLWKSVEDISAPIMPGDMIGENVGPRVEEKMINPDNMGGAKINPSEYDSHQEVVLQCGHNGELSSLNALSETDLADISNSLLNFTNDDELTCLESDGKETIDNSSYVSLDSLLVTSNNVHEDDGQNIKDTQASVSETCLAHSNDAFPAELNVVIDQQSHSDNGGQHAIHKLEDRSLSISALDSFPPGPYDGYMECILNTEDPEIPCNDDVFLGKTCSSRELPGHEEGKVPTSSFTNVKDKPELSMTKKEENPTNVFDASPMVDSDTVLQTSRNYPLAAGGVKSEADGGKFVSIIGNANTATVDSNKVPYPATNEAPEKDPLNTCNSTDDPLHGKASSTLDKSLEAAADSSALYQEESDSDDIIPCFSDIEAMILEMDLFPEGSDSCISKKVSRYQNEDTKRTIIRLEQSARSSMQRAIASQGALAVLYGRHSKHYIKKSEVILGRATNDFDVDIDLGKEGRPNRISRRQAIIKMDDEGSFFLKNLSKILVCINGKDVSNGEITPLTNNCLIEIRGMGFVFEVDQKSVRRYLEKDKQARNNNFEWSQPER